MGTKNDFWEALSRSTILRQALLVLRGTIPVLTNFVTWCRFWHIFLCGFGVRPT